MIVSDSAVVEVGPDRPLSIEALHAVVYRRAPLRLTAVARRAIADARALVDRIVDERRVVYGITTGFGPLAGTLIDPRRAEALQRNLIAHLCTGVGPALSVDHVRSMMAARFATLSLGHSGVGVETLELLGAMIERGVTPVVPSIGTVGASGDLTPLAHVAATLQGEGRVAVDDQTVAAVEGLRRAGLRPVRFGAKEALGIVNGTSAMTAIAALTVREAEAQLNLAVRAGVLYAEVLGARAEAFDPRVGSLRPHPGQRRVHTMIAALSRNGARLSGSATADVLPLNETDDAIVAIDDPIQDPYTVRCIPQLYGACFDALEFCSQTVERELASVTDNPLLLPHDETVLQAGNFFGQHIASACDTLVNAVVSAANHLDRSIDRLTDPVRSRGLPAMLQPRDAGLQSGFMGAQVTATAIVAEMRTRATPSSIQSLPTNAANQDIVTMGTVGARNAAWHVERLWELLAIFCMVLAQAAELRSHESARDDRRRADQCGVSDDEGVVRSDAGEDELAAAGFCSTSVQLVQSVREVVAPLRDDRALSDDINHLARFLRRRWALMERSW